MRIENIEKKIPENMMYKEASIKNGVLYWVTQDVFDEKDLLKFQKAMAEENIKKAYVTVRDLSCYDFNEDLRNKVLAKITTNKIDAKSYLKAIKRENLI